MSLVEKRNVVDSSIVKPSRGKKKIDDAVDTSMHSAQSKHSMATTGETSTVTNTSRFSQVDSWAFNSLVPDGEDNSKGFLDSFVVNNEESRANPWWEDLESPCVTPRQPVGQPVECDENHDSKALKPENHDSKAPKPENHDCKSSSPSKGSSSKGSRSSKPRKRDSTPKSPTRNASYEVSDDNVRHKRRGRDEKKESRSRRASSKSPSKARDQRPSCRRCLSHSSIEDIPAIDLRESPKKSAPRPSHRRSRSQDFSPTRRDKRNGKGTETTRRREASPKRSENPKTRRSSIERKESLTKRREGPRPESPSKKRYESPIRVRHERETTDSIPHHRSSPRKTRSSPVREPKRKIGSSSRKTKSSTVGPNKRTEEDLLNFITSQIKALEESADVAINFTVTRRASMTEAQTGSAEDNVRQQSGSGGGRRNSLQFV